MVSLAVALACSLAANAYLWWRTRTAESEPSYDARQLLHDLTRGEAVIRIKRIDPDDILIRSPRGRL